MKEIKKSSSLKSKVKGKETPFNIDLNYSPEYDSFIVKVKKDVGFMSYTDSLQGLPLEVVKKLNNMLEEVLVQADSKYHTKKFDYDYADIGQFSLSDSEGKKTEQEYIDLGKKIVKTKFNGDLDKAYDSVVRNKREFGGDFQAGVYAMGGSLKAHGIEVGDTFVKTISGNIQKVKDKNGKIVYVDLSTGERDSQPPLPFEGGGKVSEDLFENYKKQPKELAEIVDFYMDKYEDGDYDYQDSKNFLKEVEAIGYTFDYGLDNEPYGLRPIGTRLKKYDDGGGVGMEEDIDLSDDNRLRVRKPAMPNRKLTNQELAEKHNSSAYEFMKDDKKAFGGSLFSSVKMIPKARKYPNLQDKDVVLKNGKLVKVFSQSENKLTVMEFGKIGSGERPMTVDISEVETIYKNGGMLVGNQKRIDMNKNGKIDAEDFRLLRSSMNGAWRNDHKHVNHDEDYEVRYARPRPNRTGYKGIRKFATGGGMSFDSSMSSFDGLSFGGKNPKTEKYSVYIEYGNDDENEVKDVELDFPSLQQASNVYKQYSKSNTYKGQEIFDIYILKHYKNGDYEKVDDKYSKGGYVEITDPKKDLFDKGYAIYGGDAWEKFEDVKKIPLPKGAFIVKVKTNNNDYFAIAEKRKFATGGGISNFERLSRVVAKNYEGKSVKPKYQKQYGKTYSKSEAKEVGNKVAGKVKANQKMNTGGKLGKIYVVQYELNGDKKTSEYLLYENDRVENMLPSNAKIISIKEKMNTGGQTKKGGNGSIMILAKKIRKDGESWQDALKRAGQQLK